MAADTAKHQGVLPLKAFDHSSREVLNLERSRMFYCGILGFQVVPRPPFECEGYWLHGYGLNLHLVQTRDKNARIEVVKARLKHFLTALPRVDHIAFCTDRFEEVVSVFDENDIYYKREQPADGMDQMFFFDPDGNVVEITSTTPVFQRRLMGTCVSSVCSSSVSSDDLHATHRVHINGRKLSRMDSLVYSKTTPDDDTAGDEGTSNERVKAVVSMDVSVSVSVNPFNSSSTQLSEPQKSPLMTKTPTGIADVINSPKIDSQLNSLNPSPINLPRRVSDAVYNPAVSSEADAFITVCTATDGTSRVRPPSISPESAMYASYEMDDSSQMSSRHSDMSDSNGANHDFSIPVGHCRQVSLTESIMGSMEGSFSSRISESSGTSAGQSED
jgi:catechol 2,3-dioxygenase-like lactoylglutathione lyase family enzyme